VIEQIRDLEHALQMRAANGRGKVAIIPDADRLQPQAANAFLKTLEEPPNDSLLLLLTALPEALPETILSRCIAIPLALENVRQPTNNEAKLVKLLQQAARQESWTIQFAYRLAQDFQTLLRELRAAVKGETDEALKREQARYKDATDGAWLDEREEYYKALTESLYLEQRGALIETLFARAMVWRRGISPMPAKTLPHWPPASAPRKSLSGFVVWKSYATNWTAILTKHSQSK